MAKIIPYEDYIKIVEEEIRKSYKDAFPNAEAVLRYMKTKEGQDIVKGEYHNWKESTADFYDGNEAHFDPFKDRLPDCPVSPMDKRDIPARVTVTTATKRCPSCNKQLSGRGNIHSNYRYCRWCGQALDWTEE